MTGDFRTDTEMKITAHITNCSSILSTRTVKFHTDVPNETLSHLASDNWCLLRSKTPRADGVPIVYNIQ